MDFGTRLKRIREQRGMTLKELADKIGRSESTVSRYESGKVKNIDLDIVEQISEVLKVSPAYMMGWIDEQAGTKTRKIPILGEIACGDPITAEENFDGVIEEVEFGLPSGDLIYLRAKGDSMSPTIEEGNLVLIRLQSDVEQNQIAAVMLNGADVTLKRVKKQNGTIILVSDNNKYDPIVVTDDTPIKIIGWAETKRANLY